MLIIIFGWIIHNFGPYYSSYIILSPEAMFFYIARMIDAYIIAGAMNAPILFIFRLILFYIHFIIFSH
jgi:hypothetical protein